MSRRAALLLASCLLPLRAVAAPVHVELPPGENPLNWQAALGLAQQLVPDLSLGPALGPGPSVRIIAGKDAWWLDIYTTQGRRAPLTVRPPDNDDARVELLLVCTEVLGQATPGTPSLPPVVPVAQVAPPVDPVPARNAWQMPWIAAAVGLTAVGLPTGESPPLWILVEPIAWRAARLDVGPFVALGRATAIQDDLVIQAPHLGMEAAWTSPRPWSWKAGVEVGLGLRTLSQDDRDLLRDWTAAVGARASLVWPAVGRWRLETGLRGVGDVPPTRLVWQGQAIDLPTWQVQAMVGVRVPHRAEE